LQDDAATRAALLESRLALTDSGLLVLLWNCLRRDRVPRISGLAYLQRLLQDESLQVPGATFWIMPSAAAARQNHIWLRDQGLQVEDEDTYIAPMYGTGAIEDPELLRILTMRRPGQVFIALGGGVQERLGAYLQRGLPYRPAIHCIGAAIGFLSGVQVRIPLWADRLRLGWLARCLADPARFVPRYWKARKLVGLMLRYGEHLPPLRDQ
jgi:UDP-N-acetyl-D-mannosaminuronic acid transferase (WecB/TagA/CpsF family)